MPPISAVLIVNTEEANIRRCLEAILQVTNDIVVVDSGSTDNTPTICEKMEVRVFHFGWKGYAANKNFGNQQAKHDWILSIDADEVLSEELIQSIKNISFSSNTVYQVNRKTNFCGTWINYCGWYPEWKVRLFDRNQVKWQGDFVHETLAIPAHFKQEKLNGHLYHYSYKDLADYEERMDRYSTLSAQELFAKGKSTNLLKQYLAPAFRFFKTYILKLGILDGKSGWIISKGAAKTVWMKYQKLAKIKHTK